MIARWFQSHDCSWRGWWLVYPLDNLRRVWRNVTEARHAA